jgi:3-hexulose-6-phosphate synthase/6-phospho-3-hexuloisomerase
MKPVLQVALDFIDLDRAMKCAREAAAGGAEWLEAGTPLIKSEGLAVVRALREAFPHHHIVADLKVMDAGRTELEMAAKAGANSASVLGLASDATIRDSMDLLMFISNCCKSPCILYRLAFCLYNREIVAE